MAEVSNSSAWPDPAPQTAAVLRDEVAEHRVRRGHAVARLHAEELDEPDREAYELRLDAYEVQVEGYRRRLEDISGRLRAAHRDGLTGTWLRQAGRELLDEELQRADRAGTPVSVAFVDVDGLKAVNDSRGHGAGDGLLRYVAGVLRDQLRDYDVVVRHGGDEFLCALPGMDMAEATARLKHVHVALAASAHSCSVTAGIAVLEDDDTLDTLIGRADKALYEHRAARRGRIDAS